jgi:hypothetical protein
MVLPPSANKLDAHVRRYASNKCAHPEEHRQSKGAESRDVASLYPVPPCDNKIHRKGKQASKDECLNSHLTK